MVLARAGQAAVDDYRGPTRIAQTIEGTLWVRRGAGVRLSLGKTIKIGLAALAQKHIGKNAKLSRQILPNRFLQQYGSNGEKIGHVPDGRIGGGSEKRQGEVGKQNAFNGIKNLPQLFLKKASFIIFISAFILGREDEKFHHGMGEFQLHRGS